MKTQCDVIVVGGGASGLLCAFVGKARVQVTVLERIIELVKTIGNRKWQMQFYQFTYE